MESLRNDAYGYHFVTVSRTKLRDKLIHSLFFVKLSSKNLRAQSLKPVQTDQFPDRGKPNQSFSAGDELSHAFAERTVGIGALRTVFTQTTMSQKSQLLFTYSVSSQNPGQYQIKDRYPVV